MRFEDTVLLATRAASGLGAATARRFADERREGRVVAEIESGAAEELAASLPDVLAVTVDTSDPRSVEPAVATAVSHLRRRWSSGFQAAATATSAGPAAAGA